MGPLEGIKVIEIAGIGPCPITGMMLADLGAEVILVERAAENPNGAGVGGVIESAFFRRGKKSIALDLKIPESINWSATDGGVTNENAKAMMMGVWDDKTSECLRIDLWTKDMLMDDMKRMFHQTFISMADGYERATEDLSLIHI